MTFKPWFQYYEENKEALDKFSKEELQAAQESYNKSLTRFLIRTSPIHNAICRDMSKEEREAYIEEQVNKPIFNYYKYKTTANMKLETMIKEAAKEVIDIEPRYEVEIGVGESRQTIYIPKQLLEEFIHIMKREELANRKKVY